MGRLISAPISARWMSFLELQINETTNISTFFQINTIFFIWAKTFARLHTTEDILLQTKSGKIMHAFKFARRELILRNLPSKTMR